MTYTATLASWVANLRPQELPQAQAAWTKRVLLDAFGSALYGAHLPWSRRLHASVARLGDGAGHVIGIGRRLPADRAALLNGSFVQAYELDDYHQDAGVHSAACVVPAAMAAADIRGAVTGEQFLTAVLVGFEVAARVGRCMDPVSVVAMGWHTGSVFAPLAAAAAAASVFGLDAGQVNNAFGIAATQAGGLAAVQYGSMVKRMQHGRGAQSGLYAALLAGDGYTGIVDVFDLEYGGTCSTFVKGDTPDLERLTAGLGHEYALDRIGLKPYACNAAIHTSLDALREITQRTGVHPSDITGVTVRMSKAGFEHVGWPYSDPSETAAQMNLQFCVAAWLLQGDVFIEQFTPENVRSPELIEYARRVHPIHDGDIDRLGPSLRHRVEVTVETADGRSETRAEDYGRGSPERPLADADVLTKFRRLAELGGVTSGAEELGRAILAIDTLPSVDELFDRLISTGLPHKGPVSYAGAMSTERT